MVKLGRTEVFCVEATDIASLISPGVDEQGQLYHLRAADTLRPILGRDLIKEYSGATAEATRITSRMEISVLKGGKAVWSDSFIQAFSPVSLSMEQIVTVDSAIRHVGDGLSSDPQSHLRYAQLRSVNLKLFPEGCLIYTAGFELHALDPNAEHQGLLSVDTAIPTIKHLSDLTAANFRRELRSLLANADFRNALERASENHSPGSLNLMRPAQFEEQRLAAASHILILAEGFYSLDDALHEPQRLPTEIVIHTPELAGLVNQASWYKVYSRDYLQSLSRKNIGYRADEIYLNDSNSTIAISEGFWSSDSETGGTFDTRTYYRWDVLLAVEYIISRLAQHEELLRYLRTDSELSRISAKSALEALRDVADARSILRQLEESLNLDLLVNQGFTRKLMREIRGGVGLNVRLELIRARVSDAWEEVQALSALSVAGDSLAAANENNSIQKNLRIWAIIAALLAIISIAAPIVYSIAYHGR